MCEIKGLSLFANVGIAEAMFDEIGVKILLANEIDERRARFYSEVYPDTEMICGDITDDSIRDHIAPQLVQFAFNYKYNLIEIKDIIVKNMLDNGIDITDYMGAQGSAINHTNGGISLQVFGFIVKDGKLVKGFIPAIMTTTIFELLSNIEMIGNDLTFTNTACASPSLLIKNISIAS